MTAYETLLIEKKNSILLITLNRPHVRNAINSVMMKELAYCFKKMSQQRDTRCIILTGKENAFCAGADLKEREGLDLKTWNKQHRFLEQAMRLLVTCDIPTIAAVNGAAFGGGLELVLACDFAYAATTARFAQSEVKWGLIPGAMGSQLLPRACGVKRAKELSLTGESFTAKEAYEWGIINTACEPDELMNTVLATAKKIAANAPLAIRSLKKLQYLSETVEPLSGYKKEMAAYHQILKTQDRKEGISAFNEKRTPNFKGK